MLKLSTSTRKAFTVVEIMLVIALIVLLSGVTVAIVTLNSDSINSRAPENVCISAIKSLRLTAIEKGRDTSLIFDKRGFFILRDTETAEEFNRIFFSKPAQSAWEESKKSGKEIDWRNFPNQVDVIFHLNPPSVIGSTTREYLEVPVSYLRASPDSSMTPVKIEISQSQKITIIEIDPFCGLEKISHER